MTVHFARTTDVQTCLALRKAVFIDEQGVPENEEADTYDATALHFLAIDSDLPVGTARIIISGKIAKIGRVCVLKSHRGTGLGKGLMLAVMGHLGNVDDIETAVLGSQTHAIGFYKSLGFEVVGREYMDAGIPHFDMELSL